MSAENELDRLLVEVREVVESFFGDPFIELYQIIVRRTRADLDAVFLAAWRAWLDRLVVVR